MDFSTDLANWDFTNYFISMMITGIGIGLLSTGAFTSYFGAGKSQKIGYGLLLSGILILIIIYVLTFDAGEGIDNAFEEDLFMDALISGLSALAGMMIGMFIILFVLMKVDTVDDLEDLDLDDLEDLDLDEELKKLEEELNNNENSNEKEEEEE